MGRRGQKQVTLFHGCANFADGPAILLAESALHQLGRGGRGAPGEVALLAEENRKPAADGIARRGRCRLVDKTLYDAMQPAADAFGSAVAHGAGREAAVHAAIRAARDGMHATTPLVARRGLALRLGERSRGHQDPGATSCYLLFRSLLASGRSPR